MMNKKDNKAKKPNPRRQSRRYAVQALYQWHYTQNTADELIQQFIDEHQLCHADKKYFKDIVGGALREMQRLDEQLTPCLDRRLTDLGPVELAILRLAIYELLYRPELPYRVVINEALELTKEFGAQDGHKYVNAVLDQFRVSSSNK